MSSYSIPALNNQALLSDLAATGQRKRRVLPVESFTAEDSSLPQARHTLTPLSSDELYAEGQNMPTLTAENAPPASPIYRGGPMPETIKVGVESPNPLIHREAAHDQLSATYGDEIGGLLSPGPKMQAWEDAQANPPDFYKPRAGFGNKLKHVLGSGLKAGLLAASRGPAEGAIGRLLGGGAAGMISPGTADKYAYEAVTEPRMLADAQNEQAMQQHRLAGVTGVANLTGELPNNRPTAATMHRIALEGQADKRIGQVDEKMAETHRMNNERVKRYAGLADRDRKKQVASDYKNGMFGDDPEMLDWAAGQLGIPGELKPQFIRGMMRDGIDGDGNLIQVNRQTGKATAVTSENGRPVTSFQGTQEKNRTARTQMLINAGLTRQSAELQVRKEIEASREAAEEARRAADVEAGKYTKSGRHDSLRKRAEDSSTPPSNPPKTYSSATVKKLAADAGISEDEMRSQMQAEAKAKGLTLVFK